MITPLMSVLQWRVWHKSSLRRTKIWNNKNENLTVRFFTIRLQCWGVWVVLRVNLKKNMKKWKKVSSAHKIIINCQKNVSSYAKICFITKWWGLNIKHSIQPKSVHKIYINEMFDMKLNRNECKDFDFYPFNL